jgi:hypothetical protein
MTILNNASSKSNKGRKRKQNSESGTLRNLIEAQVVPKWTDYLRKKMESNEAKESGVIPRDDTIWKKIFRDLREFYRILFKQRFHNLDYKTCEQADDCCILLLKELNIDTSGLEAYDIRKVFYFFHQTRLNSSDHYMSEYTETEGEIYAMDIIEKYKDSLKAMFMIDSVASKLFYTVFCNFDYIYNCFLKTKYKGIIDVAITS